MNLPLNLLKPFEVAKILGITTPKLLRLNQLGYIVAAQKSPKRGNNYYDMDYLRNLGSVGEYMELCGKLTILCLW